MIWIYSFARSGSSIFQQFLAKVLNFDVIYEPIGFVPRKIPKKNNHALIHKWFRGAPPLKTADKDCKVADFYLGYIPDDKLNSPDIEPYKTELKKFFKDIYDCYGENSVVKLINQLSNVKFIHYILKELRIEPTYIIFKRDAFEIAYSFYRRGGFQRLSYWYYAPLYEYRKKLYKNNRLLARAKTPLDKWVATVLSDYEKLDESYLWLKENNIKSILINYEDFILNPRKTCMETVKSLNLEASESQLNKVVSYYMTDAPNAFNISKAHMGTTDPLYIKFVKETCENLSLDFPVHYLNKKPKLKAEHFRYLLNNNLFSHIFIRAYEAIKRRVKKRKLFLSGLYYN